jgi:hypothetical protein
MNFPSVRALAVVSAGFALSSAACGGLPADAAAVFDLPDSALTLGANDGASGSANDDATAGADEATATQDAPSHAPPGADARAEDSAPHPDAPTLDATNLDTATDEGVVDDGTRGAAVCSEPGAALFDDHCYIPLKPRSWTAARDFCQALTPSAHLVTITSAGEQRFVESLLGGGERWIGLSRVDGPDFSRSAYVWIDGEARSYEHWDSSTPSDPEPNGSGTCVRLRTSGFWGDYYCDTKLSAICEREP